jgi:cysteine synthase A
MAQIFSDNSLSVGRTPLVKLNHIVPAGASIFGKVEGRNPAYSVKCRIGVAMIEDAIERGVLKPGMEIIEPTSGNTGIALAFVAAAKSIKLTLTMPETMSIERRKILKAFGANLILTPGGKGMVGAVQEAETLAETQPDKYLLLHQFKNPANPAIHVKTTGPEIWDATDGAVDVIVAGVGTGGTISGIARYFKEVRGLEVTSVAVEPAESPVISQHLAGEMLQPGPHKIQGIGAGFIPATLDLTMVDRVEKVSSEQAYKFARLLAKKEGLLSGISSGAAVAAAVRLAELPEFKEKNIVVILPDSGERYLSGDLFSEE